MPYINRIRLVNIGVEDSFLADHIINIGGGFNTVIFADNGVGKSMLISFILTTLYPYKTKYLKGDGDDRSFSDYLDTRSPSHIIIEWVFDRNNPSEYLITGMSAIKIQNTEYKPFFYSFRYKSKVSKEEFFLDNMPIFNDEGGLQNIRKYREILKKSSKQQIKITDQIGKWIIFLSDNKIDSGLIKTQISMNDSEGNQGNLLRSKSELDFIHFLVDNLETIENDDNYEEVRSAYNQFHKVPMIQEQIKITKQIIDQLEKGRKLQDDLKVIENKFESEFDNWNIFQRQYFILDENLNNYKLDLENDRELLFKKKQSLNSELGEKELDKNFVSARKSEFLILLNNGKIQINQDIVYKLKRTNEIYTVLPSFSEYKKKKEEFIELQMIISDRYSDIQKKLENIRLQAQYLCKKEETLELERKTKIEDKINELSKKFKKIIKNLGSIEESNKISKERMLNNELRLKDLDLKIEEIKDLIINNNIDLAIKNKNDEIDELEAKKDEIEISIEENRRFTREFKDEINKLELSNNTILRNIKIIDEFFSNRYKDWVEFTQNNQLQILFGNESLFSEISYEFLSQNNINILKKEIDDKNTQKFKEEEFIERLTTIIDFYNENEGNFPSNPDSLKMIELLNQTTSELKSFSGWTYLKEKYPNNEDAKLIAENIPHILNGVIAITNDNQDIQEAIDEIKKLNRGNILSGPVIISNPNIFLDTRNLKNSENYKVFCPSMEWIYDEVKAEEKFDKLNEQLEESKKKKNTLTQIIDSLSQSLTLWKNFLKNYPKSISESQNREKKQNNEDFIKNRIIYDEIKQKEEEIHRKNKRLLVEKNKINEMLKENQHIKGKLQICKGNFEEKEKIDSENKVLALKISQNNTAKVLKEEERDETEVNISRFEKQYSDIKIRLDQLNHSKSKLELKYSPIIFSDDDLGDLTQGKDFSTQWNIFIELQKQYNNEISEDEQNQLLKQLEKETEKKEREFEKLAKIYSIKFDDNELISLNKLGKSINEIESEKKRNEEERISLESQIKELKSQNKQLKKDLNYLQSIFLNFEKELKIKFNNTKTIEELDGVIKDLESEIDLIKSDITINIDEIQLKENNISENEDKLKSMENLGEIINIYLDKFSSKRSDLISRNLDYESDIDFYEFQEKINQLKENSKKTLIELDRLSKSAESFVKSMKEIRENYEIDELRIIEFLDDYKLSRISSIDMDIENFSTLLTQFEIIIKTPEKRLNNIIRLYAERIESIEDKIMNLQKVKFNLEEFPHYHKKRVLKIDVIKLDKMEVISSVNRYFNKLFKDNEVFPENLSNQKMIKEIFDHYLENKLRSIKVLFPTEQIITKYLRITDFGKKSGGESLTISILIFCLLAHFRMRYIFGDDTKNYSIPLLMDNPFGRAKRKDMIGMQTALANSLNIQLIPFSGNDEIGAFSYFDSLTAIRKGKSQNGNIVLRTDLDLGNSLLESSKISTKPKKELEILKLDNFGV